MSEITGAGPRLPTVARAVLGCSCLVAASPCPGSAQVERWTLERTVTIGDALDPETGLTRVGDVIVLGDPEGLPRDTVAMIVGRSGITQFVGSGWTSYVSIPESYRSLLSVAPDGSGFVVVHRTGATSAEPHTFRVIRFDARADTAWAHEVRYDPIPVPREWRARHVEEYVRDFGELR